MNEIWKYWGAGLDVSSRGRVRSRSRVVVRRNGRKQAVKGLIRKPWKHESGHLTVKVNGKHIRVHRMVLEAFVGKCPAGMQCRHKNGKPTDNRWPENIEWNTKSRNQRDVLFHGGRKSSVVTLATARGVKRALTKATYKGQIRDIAKQFGISRRLVSSIRDGAIHVEA